MRVFRIDEENKNLLDEFLSSQELASIHQTYEWGVFQARHPGRRKFWVVVAEEGGKIVGSMVVVRVSFPMQKSWLMCPRGPVCDYGNTEVLGGMLNECSLIAKEEDAVFLRIETPLELPVDEVVCRNLRRFGFRRAHAHHQPECTLMIDISVEDEAILAQMKQKGRYNIRLAEKKGVVIRESDGGAGDVDAFYKLVSTTTSRNGFHGHDRDFYKNMLEVLDGSGGAEAKLYLAEYEGEVIAGMIATFYKDVGIYYYGGSGNEYRNVMAPYLLQWYGMKEAKAKGCKKYDLFGIAPEGEKNHPWREVTEFKKKFGGEVVDYLRAQEKVYQKGWYWLVRLRKTVRAIF